MSLITLTGKSMEDVRSHLGRVLDPEAYKEVGGRSYLTDINPAWLRESLTDCFGLQGMGWWIEVADQSIGPNDSPKKPWYGSMELALFYVMEDEDFHKETSHPIPGFGGHQASHIEDALKGAKTNALGDCAKELLWQIKVFRGEISHKKKAEATKTDPVKSSQNGGTKTQSAEGQRETLSSDVLKHKIEVKVERFGEYNASDKFRGFVRGGLAQLFSESQDVDAEVHALLNFLFGIDTSKELKGAQVKALRNWLDMTDEGPNPASVAEAKEIIGAVVVTEDPEVAES